jgi:hypothetical protein
MDDSARYRIALMGCQAYCLVFQINQKLALEHEKELVFFFVFMPVEFALHNAEANHAVIHLTKRLVVPLLIAIGDETSYVNQLEEAEPGV